MSYQDSFIPCKFRGLGFFVENEVVVRGLKAAVHEFPNENRRVVQQLGKLPPVFPVEMILIEGAGKQDLLIQRDNMIAALEEETEGQLEYTSQGIITVEVISDVSVKHSHKELNRIYITVTFSQKVSTEVVRSSHESIQLKTDTFISGITDAIQEVYKSPLTPDERSTITGSLDKIRRETMDVTNLLQDTEELNARVVTLSNRAPFIINEPKVLGDRIQGIIETWQNSDDDNIVKANSLRKTFGKIETDKPAAVAPNNIEFNRSATIVEDIYSAGILAIFYEVSTDITFNTIDEIESIKADTDAEFNRIVEPIERGIESFPDKSDYVKELEDLRNIFSDFLNEAELKAFATIEIQLSSPTTSLALAYKLYGARSDEFEPLIRELNSEQLPTNLNGTVRVLEDIN